MQNDPNKLIVNLIQKEFYNEEIAFSLSKERKEKRWNIHSRITRKVKTSYGILLLQKIKYRDKNRKIRYFDNPVLKIPKYKNICEDLENKVFMLKLDGVSNRSIAQNHLNKAITRQYVSTILNSRKVENKVNFTAENIIHKNILYVEVDDTFSYFRDKNNKIVKHRLRTIVCHTGKDKFNNLTNKTVIIQDTIVDKNNSSLHELYFKIRLLIYKHYGDQIKQIIFYGDGARYMKGLAKLLNSTYILDLFHLTRKLFMLCGFSKYNTKNKALFIDFLQQNKITLYRFSKLLIIKGKWQQAISLLEEEFAKRKDQISSTKIQELKDFYKYLKSNETAIVNYENEFNIGSHTEAFISHYVKKICKRKFAIYGNECFKNLLLMNIKNNENLIFI
ncbi:Uncharacterised protein [Mycoplasmopsis columboralis]|uniref:Transposase n=1 Tax=Mycoplasmopsis columboralis TaxID=171282 RepID=A0A449B6L8_9BACT|nr:UPF0236 family protein [Mycoplasmopsis columboralis]VEU76250.1 Uncharacterised protein [Mycoplasmopsis columboralis]